jgi:hypothetical protein
MKKYFLFIALFIAACQHKAVKVSVGFDKAQGAVKVTGIPQEILYTIKADTFNINTWQNLFPVSIMPADTELKNYQRPITGKYKVSDKDISFIPDTPFATGKTYFARYYIYNDDVNRMQLLQQKNLPGTPTYTELIFKY